MNFQTHIVKSKIIHTDFVEDKNVKVESKVSLIISNINTDNKSLNFFAAAPTSFFSYVFHLNKFLSFSHTLGFGQLINSINH
jgi:hypothetical protein